METTETTETPTNSVPENTPQTAAPATPTPPPVVGEPPQDPDVVGSLTPAEMGGLSGLRQRMSQITNEIGQAEVRKARMLAMLSEMEEQAQGLIQAVGKRLNIPEGQQFQILPDGRLRVIKVPTQPVAKA